MTLITIILSVIIYNAWEGVFILISFNEELFAQKLKEYRGNRSQSEVADELGINRATISLMENGKQIPTLDMLQKFCDKAHYSIDTFFVKSESSPIMLLMGKLRETDKSKLMDVINRIRIREKYYAISKRCEG